MLQTLATIVLTGLLLPQSLGFFAPAMPDYAFPSDQAIAAPPLPERIPNDSVGLRTSARSILVTDTASGLGLYSKAPTQLAPIASITKLMTALVVLDAQLDWDEEITIAPQDQRAGNIVALGTGDRVSLRDTFNVMLIASSNEASAALARRVSPDNFVTLMNQKAAALGMTRTFFQEPTGLDSGNVSTVLDLLLLADAAFSRPEIRAAVQRPSYTFTPVGKRARTVVSTDDLLGSFLNQDEFSIVGGKTGYLSDAGYCLLLRVNHQDGRSLTLALLGAATAGDRWQEAKGLMDWVLDNYAWPAADNSQH